MARKFYFIFLLALLLMEASPNFIYGSQDLYIEITPNEVQQGRTSLIKVWTTEDITRVEAVFDNRVLPFYLSAEGYWVGLVAIDMNSETGIFPMQIVTSQGEQIISNQTVNLTVIWGGFFYQNINVSSDLTSLLDPILNSNEIDTLTSAYNRYTPTKFWDGHLQLPTSAQISEFGGIRNYNNGQLEGRHTGTDFRAGLGESVFAAGSGRIVYAHQLAIHGNHVVIDHGVGVLTGYSHLSEIYVVPGQWVLAGDVIGAVGATGRAEGAHIHFEVVVNGLWVDPIQFDTLSIPEANLLP